MFTDNKYTRVYYKIIELAKSRSITGYIERHHIIPKSLGGTNDPTNIVSLTAREHFICHRLLVYMVSSEYKHKMAFASWQQSRSAKYHNVRITARTYEVLRIQLSLTYTGRKRAPFSDTWRQNMSKRAQGSKNNMFGKNHSEKSKNKISKNRKGKCTGTANPFFGKQHSEDVRKLISENNKNRPKVVCPHCQGTFDVGMATRWHLDNCKLNPLIHMVCPNDQC